MDSPSFQDRLLLALAIMLTCIGAVGAVLPVLPTTPFLLLALAVAGRGSPRFRWWLMRHPRYGATVRAWLRCGAVSAQAKWAACLMMAASLLISWFLGMDGRLLAALAVLFCCVAVWLLRRPVASVTRSVERDQ